MRKEIFMAIVKQLKEQVKEIQYIDLWNEQLAEIKGENAWPTPSVFVEFEQYEVRQMANHVRTADVSVRLHIITRAVPYNSNDTERMAAALSYFDTIDRVNASMSTLSGNCFTTFMLTATATNHNHAQLIESIERHTCRAVDSSASRKAQTHEVKQLTVQQIIDNV